MHRPAGVQLHPEHPVSSGSGWLEAAVVQNALDHTLRQQIVEDILCGGAERADPTTEALGRIDRSLAALTGIPRDQRGQRWHASVDWLLAARLRHMADRDRGYRVVDRLTNRLKRATA